MTQTNGYTCGLAYHVNTQIYLTNIPDYMNQSQNLLSKILNPRLSPSGASAVWVCQSKAGLSLPGLRSCQNIAMPLLEGMGI
jgi:hypothetical protein